MDEATNGGRFLGAVGSPLLSEVLRSTTRLVPSPIDSSKSVYDDWLAHLQTKKAKGGEDGQLTDPSLGLIGTGSDYTAFYHHLGIPSVDMLFNQQGQGVYPYHSNYDSYYWLDRFGDVGFTKHKAMSQLWGLVAVRLAGTQLIPFRVADYSESLERNMALLEAEYPRVLDYSAAKSIMSQFHKVALRFDEACHAVSLAGPDGRAALEDLNRAIIQLERVFLLEKGHGLSGRPWYRHQVR